MGNQAFPQFSSRLHLTILQWTSLKTSLLASVQVLLTGWTLLKNLMGAANCSLRKAKSSMHTPSENKLVQRNCQNRYLSALTHRYCIINDRRILRLPNKSIYSFALWRWYPECSKVPALQHPHRQWVLSLRKNVLTRPFKIVSVLVNFILLWVKFSLRYVPVWPLLCLLGLISHLHT